MPAGIGVDCDADGLTDLEHRAALFGNREVRVELRQVGQGHDLGAGSEKLADFDMANTELAIEWRQHALLGDDRLGLGNAGRGLVISGLRGVNGGLRAELARRQLLGAVERKLRAGRLRLETRQIALVGRIVELHQGRARLHMDAGREHDVGDTPADIGGDIDLVPAARSPTAVIRFGTTSDLASATVTEAGGGFMVAKMWVIIWPRNWVNQTSPPTRAASSSPMMMNQSTVRGGRGRGLSEIARPEMLASFTIFMSCAF